LACEYLLPFEVSVESVAPQVLGAHIIRIVVEEITIVVELIMIVIDVTMIGAT